MLALFDTFPNSSGSSGKEGVSVRSRFKLSKGSLINKNVKKIWKFCMTINKFRFQATFRGSGNFIVKLLDSNQDLEELICNEIGDYNVDKTVKVVKGNYYYVETYVSNGSWEGTWWGTYGD